MDICEQAAIEADNANNLAVSRTVAMTIGRRELIPNGQCHYCHAEVSPQKLFCNGECAEDYEHIKQLRR